MSLVKTNLTDWPVLSDLFNENWFKNRFLNGDWSPAVNVSENTDSYDIEIAAPGFKKEDFNVTVENGVLTVSGKSENEEKEKAKNYTRREFSFKSFKQSLTLPGNVDDDQVTANYTNGILTLKLVKTADNHSDKKEVTVH